ncbi:MAG: cobalamin-dependent protein [Candidatus Aenigmatarchaeota archaeon]
MKILLINPLFYFNGHLFKKNYKEINLGLLYLASVAQKEGFSVKIIALNKLETERIIKREKPDIVGISCMIGQQRAGLTIAKKVKKVNKKIIVIVGGYYPTFRYKKILEQIPEVDVVVIGEGEESFSELLRLINQKKFNYNNLKKIKGIAFKENKKIVFTGNRELPNLDKLPWPSRTLWRTVNFFASRGCRFRCRYCSITKFYRKVERFRSVKNVIEELKWLEKLGEKDVSINDDNFLDNLDWFYKFRIFYVKQRLKIRSGIMSKLLNVLRLKKLRYLKECNINEISIGLQGIGDEENKFFRTGHTLKLLEEFNKKLIRENVEFDAISIFLIINSGVKHENEESIFNKVKRVVDLLPEGAIPKKNKLALYPGTDIAEYFIKKGYYTESESVFKDDDYFNYSYADLNERKLTDLIATVDQLYEERAKRERWKKIPKRISANFLSTVNAYLIMLMRSSMSLWLKIRILMFIIYIVIKEFVSFRNPIKNDYKLGRMIKIKYF